MDERIHLELTLADDQEALGAAIASFGDARRVTDRHWVILAERSEAQAVMNRVLGEIGLHRLDDFRVATPSLEDVYLQLADETQEEEV